MRRVLIFLGLKAKEVGKAVCILLGITGAYALLSCAVAMIGILAIDTLPEAWLQWLNVTDAPKHYTGMGALCVGCVVLFAVFLYGCYRLPGWVRSNWEEAGRRAEQ